MIRSAAITLMLLLIGGAEATAQTYSPAAPAPRTNDPQQMRAAAFAREVHERFGLGLNAEARGQWDEAASEFERIVQLHPAEPAGSTAHYDLGIAYANANRNADAAREFRAALDGDPQFLAAMANLISVDIARNDLREARAIADRFQQIAPDSARALYSSGVVALRAGDMSRARTDFGRLLRSDPSYAVAHYDLGIAQCALGQYPAAEQEFALALDLSPTYARARFALGTVLLRQGRRPEARAAFAQAATDASNDPVLRNLADSMRDSIKDR